MAVPVVLLDDNDRFRRRLARRLAYFDALEVVGEAATPAAFFSMLEGLASPPEVALLDIELGPDSGIDVVARLGAEYPEVDALMLTVFDDTPNVFEAVRNGASGYLLKDADAERIVEAVLDVRAGGAPLSQSVARRLLGLVAATTVPPPRDERPDLSPREVELLQWIVAGETEAAIARRLFISPHTVRTHVKNIYRKLHVSSRAAAVRVTLEQGLLRG